MAESLFDSIPPSIFESTPAITRSSSEKREPSPTLRAGSFQPMPFVELPLLSIELKGMYKTMSETSLTSEVDVGPLDEIIGEFDEGGKMYYFARYQQGIAYKFPKAAMRAKHADLIDVYLERKANGQLAPFDPSAHYVHPLSRIRNVLNIKNKRATFKYESAHNSETDQVPDSEEEGDSDDSEDTEYEEETLSRPTRRRSTRNQAKPAKELPFSPRKTRSRRLMVISDSENDSAVRTQLRRSGRTRKSVRVNLDVDSYTEDEDSDGYAIASRPKSGQKRAKMQRGKASRPAYGHFRSTADLEYDVSNDENAPLKEHRGICEKCHRKPANQLLTALAKTKTKSRKRKQTPEDELEESGDEEDKLTSLGGWVRCLNCPVAAHWRCLAAPQREEILKAARERDIAEWRNTMPHDEVFDQDGNPKLHSDEPGKRSGLDVYQTTEFICGSCMKGGLCMGCMEVALEADPLLRIKSADKASTTLGSLPKDTQDTPITGNADVEMKDLSRDGPSAFETSSMPTEMLYRCLTCKRLSHYSHLPKPMDLDPDASIGDVAWYYQEHTSWQCADCFSYTYSLDRIIAWRPYPSNAVEPPHPLDELPNYKSPLPREYLVKWSSRSYKRTQWVPHMWLLSTYQVKLKNFLSGGSKIELLPEAADDKKQTLTDLTTDKPPLTFETPVEQSRETSMKPETDDFSLPTDPCPDAEKRIPPAWTTVDRILDIMLWYPRHKTSPHRKSHSHKPSRVHSDSEDEQDESASAKEAYDAAFDAGEQPDPKDMQSIEDWEKRNGTRFSIDYIGLVVWAFIKWVDLDYEDATWDSPPRPEDATYPAFELAMQRFIYSRSIFITKGTRSVFARDGPFYKRDGFMHSHRLKEASRLDLGQDSRLKLMPFQIDGFNWLCNNWWNLQHCILADEMGLGKTVQVTAFVGNVFAKFGACPALVVVPNSTVTNWVREFERWAPKLRVVPFYGEAKAREVIKEYELNHNQHDSDHTSAKFHVLITTYQAVLNQKDFTSVFKQPRWEILVVDEGQRLKSDSSQLFKKLSELNTIHRVIMTGTPLNNNIRELFNLMYFLDPEEWNDLGVLEKEYEVLNEELIKQLHNRLRPYFLRRIKSEVLQLPPKNEVIVPVSMTSLQKEVYRSILSHNLNLLKGLFQPSAAKGPTKAKLSNLLMQLRKCLQHPYLYAQDIEPVGLSPQEAHGKLIDASAKLRLLKQLLPKLKARGHRVLLFSQFVIALDVIEDFLVGESFKCLRLDGDTKARDRQKGMDEFNRPGSDVFIYLLSTRAGGVGINLYSADTVIIFDPDFNPHQGSIIDIQAIARAHRFGQKKTVLVFKLMVKDSAEERIIQIGKNKMVLDHLIVQNMDDEESGGDSVQSILTYGAKALFDESPGDVSRDIIYTDHDLDSLLEKTEAEGDQPQEVTNINGFKFSFAKVWAAGKDDLEEVEDDQDDSWALTLQKINQEMEKRRETEVAQTGRGARRRAAARMKSNAYLVDGSPVKVITETTSQASASEGSAYAVSDDEGQSDRSEETDIGEPEPVMGHVPASFPHAIVDDVVSDDSPAEPCGLCGEMHGDQEGDCPMTEDPQYLVEYRSILMTHAGDEPMEQRRAAIKAIDETLHKRGQAHLIVGQPLFLVENPPTMPTYSKPTANIGRYSKPVPRARLPKPGQSSSSKVDHQRTNGVHKETPPFAGPSKRPLSPTGRGESKKQKLQAGPELMSCPICHRFPYHRPVDCPIIMEGPSSTAAAILRLGSDPTLSNTMHDLRKILRKQKMLQERAARIQPS